jgi:hypothetical protein
MSRRRLRETTMRNARLLVGLMAIVCVAGCAHPMSVRPDTTKLSGAAQTGRVSKAVGLYISPDNLNKQVTTSGGGGDKVSYKPYADMQAGLYQVLGNVFQDVDVLKSMSDVGTIAKHSIAYVAVPEITTTSSSSGIFTWMATDFTISVTCRFTDVAGRPVTSVSATGTGHADFSELKHNMSLAGQLAANDALQKLQVALQQAPELPK